MAEARAVFLEGNLFRHVSVMALTSSIGLMAVFVVDFIDMIFISMLGNAALAAAVGYARAILFFTTAFGIGMSIAAGACGPRAGAGYGHRGPYDPSGLWRSLRAVVSHRADNRPEFRRWADRPGAAGLSRRAAVLRDLHRGDDRDIIHPARPYHCAFQG